MGLSLGSFLRTVGNAVLPGDPFGSGGGINVAELAPQLGDALVNRMTQDRDVLVRRDQGLPPVAIPDVYTNAPGSCPTPVSVVVQPSVRAVATAPPGYVIVECPKGSGNKVAMLKAVARSMGYWKPRRKPPIKAGDYRALMRSEATIKKLKRVVKAAGVVQRARGKR